MKTEHEKYVEIIRPLLKPKRFEHSLNVAQQAVLLAKRHGENEDRAYVAGILHKVFYSRDIVMVLYILNLLMVGVDICLYFRNKRLDEAREACSAQA